MAVGRAVRGAARGLSAAARVLGAGREPASGDDAPARDVGPAPVRRPGRDPALLARLGRWRGRPGGEAAPVPAAMSPAERAVAMRDLRQLRARLDADQGRAIDAALEAGEVTVRRLGPGDGHLWEMPGMRVFAIVGVQAFTVEDAEPDDGRVEE